MTVPVKVDEEYVSSCYTLNAMKQHVDAIYEHGVFRPLTPLPLAERERVKLVVETGQEEWLDTDAHCISDREAEPELSLEEIRAELARIPGSWADDVIAERGEY
jgi:predicted DNA-binding antitoxin AbrB/MazE fold protein